MKCGILLQNSPQPSGRLMVLLLAFVASGLLADESPSVAEGAVFSRSFVDQSQVVSKPATELYAHQSSLRIVNATGYAAYQCNDTSMEESAKGQKVRLAVFQILNPTATAKWVDVSEPGDSSNGITLTGNCVGSPILHCVNDDTLRIFFAGRQAGDTAAFSRVLYKDYTLSTGALSVLHQVKCTIAKAPEVLELTLPTVQHHLDFLFGAGFGAQFSKGTDPTCDMVEFDGQLYSTVQIKNSTEKKTLLMTNILMRSADHGTTWELLGAPDPRLLPGETPADVKILAEPALTQDSGNIYLHLRSNRKDTGYVLSKASRSDLFKFDAPVTKWTYGIGRPAICDFGKPIGMVALFTARSVNMGGAGVARNKLDVVMIDRGYTKYTRAFSIVDYDAVNTPFICEYHDEMYVIYSTGRRHLMPKFGTSEIVFTKLRREFFVQP